MTRLLQAAIKNLEELPEHRQDEIALALLSLDGERVEYGLTDEQVREVERRLAEKKPAGVSAKKTEIRLRRARA